MTDWIVLSTVSIVFLLFVGLIFYWIWRAYRHKEVLYPISDEEFVYLLSEGEIVNGRVIKGQLYLRYYSGLPLPKNVRLIEIRRGSKVLKDCMNGLRKRSNGE